MLLLLNRIYDWLFGLIWFGSVFACSVFVRLYGCLVCVPFFVFCRFGCPFCQPLLALFFSLLILVLFFGAYHATRKEEDSSHNN